MENSNQAGFTILELMIATVVFSVILLLCTFGLIQVGRMYNRGVLNSATQETTRTIIEDISQAIQFSGGQVITSIATTNGSTGFCIGQRRYSVLLGRQLPDDPTKHALVVDKLTTACTPTTPAQDLAGAGALTAGSKEFLSPFSRVSNIIVTNLGNGLYQVKIRLARGDNDLLTDPTGTNATCKTQRGSEFCSVAELTTVVQKRVE